MLNYLRSLGRSGSAGALFATLLICVAGVSGSGQTAEKKPTPTPERSREITALLGDARLAAPEIGTDAFLQVVESKKVTDPIWRKEIIEEALRMTDDVKNPVRLRPVLIRGVNFNNTEGFMVAAAHAQKLDRLSLKGRVIALLAETDRMRAKQIVFEMGGQLGLKPRSCGDNLTYDVADIYPVVVRLAKSVFTEKEILEGQRALFLAPWLENIESPTQIAPALDLVEQMQGSMSERQILFSALSKSINRNFGDDRSFSSAMVWGGGLGARVEKLTSGEQDPLKTDLNLAYRGFLLKNLNDKRCKDNEIKKGDPLPKFIETANRLLPQKTLALEDVMASELDDSAKFIDVSARSASIQQLINELGSLKGKVVDNRVVNDSGPEWESHVTEFVEKVIAWEGSNGETESETMFVKVSMFAAMIESIDEGELKKTVVRKYVRLLAGAPMQKNSFAEWLACLRLVRERNDALFFQLAPEFPNPNFRLIVGMKKIGL